MPSNLGCGEWPMRTGRDTFDLLCANVAQVALLVLGVESLEALPRQRDVEGGQSTWPIRSLVYRVSLIHQHLNDTAECFGWGEFGVWLLQNLHQSIRGPRRASAPVVVIVRAGI